jgi:U3 small nucleolar RNA-associated protein 11
MMSSRTIDGVKIGERGNKALGQEVVMLLKSQDAGYLRTVLQKTRVERKKLESSLIISEDVEKGGSSVLGKRGKKGEKKIFVESVLEQKEFAKSRRKDQIVSDDEDADAEEAIPKVDNFEDFSDEGSGSEASDEDTSTAPSHRKSQLGMLEALRKREKELVTATRELELQRAKMSNSIGGTNKNGVKFKIRERKR